MGQWSDLPADLLMMIHHHALIPDKIRLRCVCKNWQNSTLPVRLPDLRQPQPPWLLIPYAGGSVCGLYHPFEKKEYEIDLPEAGDKVFRGSGHGWVVTLQRDGSINVVNPLTRIRIPLPPRYTFPDVTAYPPRKKLVGQKYLTTKIALSCSPTSDQFIAVALYGFPLRSGLAYCRIGDETWSALDDFYNSSWYYRDVTFWDGKVYAITHAPGDLLVCDDIASCPKLRICVPIPDCIGMHTPNVHLINSSHGLMLHKTGPPSRIKHGDMVEPVEFKIFMFDKDSSSWIRIPVESTDDEILFVGLGIRLGISSLNFRGSKGNQIYVASVPSRFEYVNVRFGPGVFNIDHGSTEPLGYECHVPEICGFPIWVTPNPY